MRTLLTIKKNGRVIRRQFSRSWTRHFIEGLYCAHAQILTAAAITITDIIGDTTRLVDGDAYLQLTYSNAPKSNMQVVAPGGQGSVRVHNGSMSGTALSPLMNVGYDLPGHLIGIQVGRDATAVTPTDNQLIDRVAHGVHGASGAGVLLDSAAPADDTPNSGSATVSKIGIVYTPLRTMSLTAMRLKCCRTGNPGNVTAVIANINSNAAATYLEGSTLATSNVVNANLWLVSPGQDEQFTFAAPVTLQAGCTYIIYITPAYVSAGNLATIRMANLAATINYRCLAFTAQTTAPVPLWSYGVPFKIYGTTKAEMEFSGTDIYGLTVADPNASFHLRRIFLNNAGENIEINECGIYFPMTHYFVPFEAYQWQLTQFIVCAARDIIAPHIDVAHGESLEIVYTPSITV